MNSMIERGAGRHPMNHEMNRGKMLKEHHKKTFWILTMQELKEGYSHSFNMIKKTTVFNLMK